MDIPLISMEDGFIRSVGLGSDYVPPLSLVFDRSGIYFDPQRPSDLEAILQERRFSAQCVKRADTLRQRLLAERISKYSVGDEGVVRFGAQPDQKILLVPGQVEDDASILRGCVDIRTNLELLGEVRKLHPNDYIVYKPHPDVTSKNRRGAVDNEQLLLLCDEIVTDRSMASCLDACDEIHTMTSLAGFEALLHGRQVVTYGLPFYAGWGLTRDRHSCPRRTRLLSLQELIAGALIEYPLYIDPDRKTLVSVERAVELLSAQKAGKQTLNSGGGWRKLLRWVGGLLRWNLC